MNVLDTAGTPAEVAARIKALMPSAGTRQGDPFFEEYPLALLERLATVQAALGQRWTLEGLYAPAVLRHHLEALLAAYLRQRLHAEESQRLEALIAAYTRQGRGDLVANCRSLTISRSRGTIFRKKVTSNLIPAFRGVVGPPLGPLLSTVPGDLTWSRIVSRARSSTSPWPPLLLGEVAHRIGHVLQDLVGYLGRRYAYDVVDTAPALTVLMNEFGDVAYPLFTTALNEGGGANARFILAQQSLADAEAAMGPAQARRVLDDLGARIWCRLAVDRTAAEATEVLGLCTVQLPETGVGLAYGGVGGLRVARRIGGSWHVRPHSSADWLTALPRGEAFVRMKGEVWKLRVPLLTPPHPAVLRQMGLETLLALLPPPGTPPQHAPDQLMPATASTPVHSRPPHLVQYCWYVCRVRARRLRIRPHPLAGTPGVPSLRPSSTGLGLSPVVCVHASRSTGHLGQVAALPLRSRRWPVRTAAVWQPCPVRSPPRTEATTTLGNVSPRSR